MLRFAFAFIALVTTSGALASETPSALAQCISATGNMLGSFDVLENGSILPDDACRMLYDKRLIEGTACIRPSSGPRGKACDTRLVASSNPIGVVTCERSDGGPIGSLEIADLKDIEICAPCTLQIGSIRYSGRTVFYPYHGEPQRLCYVR